MSRTVRNLPVTDRKHRLASAKWHMQEKEIIRELVRENVFLKRRHTRKVMRGLYVQGKAAIAAFSEIRY
jgi:hypothetical protein